MLNIYFVMKASFIALRTYFVTRYLMYNVSNYLYQEEDSIISILLNTTHMIETLYHMENQENQ